MVGELAFVAVSSAGLRIIDVSNPTAPAQIGALDTPNSAYDLEVRDGIVYLADYGSVRAIDVSNPRRPSLISALDTSARAIALEGDLAYVAGLRVIDVSDPARLSEVGSVPLRLGEPTDVGVSEGLALVVGNSFSGCCSSFSVVDVSHAASPVELSWRQLGFEAFDVELEGPLAFVATWSSYAAIGVLHAIDVSRPQSPLELGAVATRSAMAIEVVAGRAYVADFHNGLRIVDFGPEYVPEPDATHLGFAALVTAAWVARRARGRSAAPRVGPARGAVR